MDERADTINFGNWLAAFWGFAEATLFFIVPDLWTSILGRDKLQRGMLACLYSSVAAVLGGLVMYFWGGQDLTGASAIVEKVPAVSEAMIHGVGSDLVDSGVAVIFLGPITATPYKIYAIHAASIGIGLVPFVVVSFLSRLVRFVIVTAFAHYCLKGVARLGLRVNPLILLLGGWGLFYAVYFTLMPS